MTTRPRLASWLDRDYLAAASMHLLRGREASYPALVTAGKLSAGDAAAGLEAMRVLVAQWRWAAQPAPPPLPAEDPATGWFGLPDAALVDLLQGAATRARAAATREPDNWEKRELADLVDALLWFQLPVHPGWSSRLMWCVALNRRPSARLAQAA